MTGFEIAALLAKMATSAAIVVLASFVVERSGPLVGALVATLPVSLGPAYLFLAIEHGAAFISAAALASLSSAAGIGAFLAAYVSLAGRRAGVAASLGAALLAWLGVALLGRTVATTFGAALALNAVVYAAGILLVRPYRAAGIAGRPPARWWELPLRAGLVMLLVGTTVLLGRLAGPEAAGLLAIAPVVFGSLALILHPRVGGPATAAVLANSMVPMLGFIAGLVLLHMTAASPVGLPLAMGGALALCVGWNFGMFALARWRRRAAPPPVAPAPHR